MFVKTKTTHELIKMPEYVRPDGTTDYAFLSGVLAGALNDLIKILPCSEHDILRLIEMAERMAE